MLEEILEKYLQEFALKLEQRINSKNVFVRSSGRTVEVWMKEGTIYSDQGVKGREMSNFNIPSEYKLADFKYTAKLPPPKDLSLWAKRNNLSLKNNQSYDQLGFALSKSIFKKGIKPSLFMTKPFIDGVMEESFEAVLDEIIKEIVEQ